ncbi:uncharacterized protein HD556DRAFT_1393950 [Suillus plorans]|uniref:Uncharacterized protein n=1 Tax=Suillus plorans TaxID=116603 RepID=A0A9P7AIB6_9AGAM|nr:uncharacterized protein HD556DRAFT_1393950 [Suillus plorans]KAG1790075.1 hypothetical protein HD556DRAFT_1393950 [Suillus plorans]
MGSTDIDIPLDAAAIMSTALEGILYGFSGLMFIGTHLGIHLQKTHEGRQSAVAADSLLSNTVGFFCVRISPLGS